MSSESNTNFELTTYDKLSALGYLKVLNKEAFEKLSEEWKMTDEAVFDGVLTTPQEILNCLACFMKTGIWLGYLFQAQKIWGIYLQSIVEPQYSVALNLVIEMGGPVDLMLYFRACYRFGYQAIPDQEYDILEKLYAQTFPYMSFLTEVTHDDDVYTTIVNDALRMSRIKSANTNRVSDMTLDTNYASLNSEKSTSIRPLRSYEEVYSYLLESPKCSTHWSIKVDGFNTKVNMKTDGTGVDIALSRGRASDSWDYTEAVSRVFTMNNIDCTNLSGKITGESVVDQGALDFLNQKYPGKDYKSPKSAAGAMLRAPQQFEESDYKYLHFYPYELGELPKDRAFQILMEAGFRVPPSITLEEGAIPLDSFDVFKSWLDSTILDVLWNRAQAEGIGKGSTDGVVLQLLTTVENDRADKYSDLNVALKFSHWTEGSYVSKVTKIIFEQRRVEMSVVLEIEPVTTRDLNVATRVSVGSPAILVNDGVREGDTITFTRKSEAINVYEGKLVTHELS